MQMDLKILYCLIRSSYTTNYNGQPLDDLSEDLFSWQNLPNNYGSQEKAQMNNTKGV